MRGPRRGRSGSNFSPARSTEVQLGAAAEMLEKLRAHGFVVAVL